jgi:protein involved in polysaccharide export with SLBB domain
VGVLWLTAPTATLGQSGDLSEEAVSRFARERAGRAAPPASSRAVEGAVDPTKYVLGPGDLLEVVYTGRSGPSERVRVSPSGRIHLEPTGPVEVAGLTLAGAEELLREILSEFYAETRISVDLLEVRTFRVHLLGHVSEPGPVEVAATSRASELLQYQTETRPGASSRNVQLRRKLGDDLSVDLVRYRLLGDLEANPVLQDGDVLYVPSQRDSISIFGRVARPGFLEYRDGDTVNGLIELGGGFESSADREAVELRRFDGDHQGESFSQILDCTGGDGLLQVRPGDGLYVRSRPDWRRERLVVLSGEVVYPGAYAIEKGEETLRTLIDRAGGFTEDAAPEATRIQRPNVFDAPENDPEFQRLQTIPVQQMTKEEQEYLKLRSRQRQGLASAVLSVGLTNGGGEDLVLRAGDRIHVPRQNFAVDVQGAVRNPGFVPFDSTYSARDYVEAAGGVSERARTGTTQIIRSQTGERVKAAPQTHVDPGDLVWVPERADRDWWRATRETAAFLAQVAAIWLVIDTATR